MSHMCSKVEPCCRVSEEHVRHRQAQGEEDRKWGKILWNWSSNYGRSYAWSTRSCSPSMTESPSSTCWNAPTRWNQPATVRRRSSAKSSSLLNSRIDVRPFLGTKLTPTSSGVMYPAVTKASITGCSNARAKATTLSARGRPGSPRSHRPMFVCATPHRSLT